MESKDQRLLGYQLSEILNPEYLEDVSGGARPTAGYFTRLFTGYHGEPDLMLDNR